MSRPARLSRLLALAVAIAVGIALAYHQRLRDSAPPEPQPPATADTPATSTAPLRPPPNVPDEDRASSDTGAVRDGDAASAPAPAQEPVGFGSGPSPAPLPEFLADGLGPPPREPDGSLTDGSAHALQERLDGESRDPQWADQVEWELENYLGLQPFTERLENVDVLCRSTVCRVTALTDRAALPDAPEDGWQGMMSRLRYERVSQEFDHSAEVVVFKASAPERIGFVTYFERRR